MDDLGSPADDLIEGGSGEGALAAFAAPAVIPATSASSSTPSPEGIESHGP